MLLTVTTTLAPATDLGYLLHKHPDRLQTFATAAGQAHVFYPEAAPERCTAALLLEVDPIALVRERKNAELTEYVNDRPYAAGSMLAVALKGAFRTALAGRCDARPELAAAPLPLTYRDDRLAGLDAAVLMEVIEHLDPGRLPALERVVFGQARPAAVVVTTPNAEYNRHFAGLAPGAMRHGDHRFEWTRAEFRDWAGRVAGAYGYRARFLPVGPEHPDDGPPTQLAVFERDGTP